MRKIFVLFVIFFKTIIIYGQETKIEISNLIIDDWFDDEDCDNDFVLTAFYNGGDKIIIDYNKGFDIGSDDDRTYTIPGILTKLEVYQYAKDARNEGFGVSLSCSKGTDDEDTMNIGVNLRSCENGFFSNRISRGGDFYQELSFNYKITPLPKPEKLNNLQDDIGFDDELTLSATAGLNTNVYNWEYGFQVGQQTITLPFPLTGEITRPIYEWFELPTSNQRQPTIVISDFLEESVLGETIYFRVRPCDGYGSEEISYNVKKSAPYIVQASGEPTKCYDSTNGELLITLNNEIDLVNDDFSIVIRDLSKIASQVGDVITYENVGSYTIERLIEEEVFESPYRIRIKGLPASDIEGFQVAYNANDEIYFSDSDNHRADFDILRNEPVQFNADLTMSSVLCHGGNDGTITVTGAGGTGSYEYSFNNLDDDIPNENEWIAFSSPSTSEHTITGLTTGNYEIIIRDTNDCDAKTLTLTTDGEYSLSKEPLVKTILVEQPKAPLSLEYIPSNVIEPTAHGFENGQIQVVIQGGTQFENEDLYTIEWKDITGKILTDVRKEVETNGDGDKILRATLFNIPAGMYLISVYDANHELASYKDTCFILNSEQALGQPDPLQITLRIDNEISCNIENEYSDGKDFVLPEGIMDQFQDGVIVAEVTGGVPFNTVSDGADCREVGSELPYCYQWRKNIAGVWTAIDVNENTIINQSVGDYALNVIDKNGITLGQYELVQNAEGVNEYILERETDALINLPQPDKLEVSFVKTAVTCNDGKDAEAEVFVTGGTPPYEYSWSTGAVTSKIENISAQAYIVYINDAKGCQIEGRVTIEQPNGLAVTPILEKSPTCFEGNDGSIEVEVTGGVSPYKLTWNTGATSQSINGLTEGTYSLTVEDFQGCKTFFETTLIDPEEIIVNLGANRSLCEDQSLMLDIGINDTGATYLWTSNNGFTSTQANVELTQEGTYTATLTTGLGCVGTGVVEVKVFDTLIDADFLITTQAYVGEEVILVNVSEPMGDHVEWVMPNNVEIVSETDEQLTMLFAEEGPYEIQLRSYQGDCFEDFYKTIIVQPAIERPEIPNGSQQLVEEFICFPNPTNGDFNVKIALTENSNITLKMLNMTTGTVLAEQTEFNQQDFLLEFYMANLPPGLYFMLLETPKGSETRKIVIE